MNKVIIGVVVVLAMGVGAFGFSRLPESEGTNQNLTVEQTENQFDVIKKRVLAGEAKLYDVRTTEEFQSGNFSTSINLPLQSIEKQQYPEVDKDFTIYLYCNSGNRSGQALELLKKAGFTQVIDLGGLREVEAIGGVLTKG